MEAAASLGGRSILITGAAGSIGSACARRFAAAGARLLLADLDGQAVERLSSELGSEHLAVQADVTRSADIMRMVDAAYDRWLFIASVAPAVTCPRMASQFAMWDAPGIFARLAANPDEVHKAILVP